LRGNLNLNGFDKLKELDCSYNQITKLILTNLARLESFSCNDNLIEEFDFNSLDPEKLTNLNLKNNNLSGQSDKKDIDISIFSKFTKLKQLLIGNDDKEKIAEGEYNHFVGSLNSLKELTELKELHISNTDINQVDIADLPEKLSTKTTYCSTEERPASGVKDIQEELYSYLTKKRLNEMYPDKSATKLTNL